jgi:hypothetical protein
MRKSRIGRGFLGLALGIGLSFSVNGSAQEPAQKHVNKGGTQKTVTLIPSTTTLIEEKSLRLIRGATGENYYEFKLAPHESIEFVLETENVNKIQMRLATVKDPSLAPEARMEALKANESLKRAGRQSVTYENKLDEPCSVFLHLRGHVNYWYKLKIQRTPEH